MNDLLIKMMLVAVATALGVSVLGVDFTNSGFGSTETITATFGLSLIAALVLVPIAYSLGERPHVRALMFRGFLWRLLAIATVAFIILPYYAARNSADATYYDTQAGLVADQIRAGTWSQIDLQAGTQMVSFVTALLYLPFGPSAAGMTFVSGLLGLVGSLCFVGAAAESLPPKRLKQYAVFVMMLPSVVFWSTLFGKDSWVFFGLGISALGVAQWFKYRQWNGAVKTLVGLGVSFAFRPYVALAVVIALAAATALSYERNRRYSPMSVIKSLTLFLLLGPVMVFMWKGVSRMTGVTELSEDSIVGRISDEGIYSKLGGGSDVETEQVHGTRAFITQLPVGTVRLLFRPWPWESTSFFMFVAALDNAVLIIVLVARRRNLVNTLRSVRSQPYAFFCLVLVIGLMMIFSTISNLGLLMREKTQITPFLYLLAFSGEREKARKRPPATVWLTRNPAAVPARSGSVAVTHTGQIGIGLEPGA